MIISAALCTELALLTEALDLPDVDIAEAVAQLACAVRAAGGSNRGLSVTLVASDVTFRFTALDEGVQPEDVRSSLLVPLTPAPEGGGEVDQTTSAVSATLLLYATAPGAFVDLAADLAWLTGRPLTDFRLDEHRMPSRGGTDPELVKESSTINQALGVLIEEGATVEQAQGELAARARHAGIDVPAAAALVVAALNPPG